MALINAGVKPPFIKNACELGFGQGISINFHSTNPSINVTGKSINKYDLLKKIAKFYKKSIKILPDESVEIDRSLDGSNFTRLSGYSPKSWDELIISMHQFNMLGK